nr:MAG TPA: major capsid protein [Caudoviricetes sp.]
MAVFSTTDTKVLMPREIADGMVKEARTTSLVAKLSGRKPMRFGNQDIIVFNDFPKAEFVEEGAEKSSTGGAFTSVTAVPHKAQVTMRFNEEVLWAAEDYQLTVVRELADAGQVALSRALDLGLFHRINPLTGKTITSWDNYLAGTSKKVVADKADADDDFRAAAGLLINTEHSWGVNGAAFDPKFSWKLASLKAKDGAGETSAMRYPQLGFGTNVTQFMGVNVAQGNTVSGTPEATDTGVRAILGDFQNGVRWGVQRQLPIELIRFGDPDGQGDLKRRNQVALRLEIVYGWYAFVDRFAIITKGATSEAA